MKNYVTIVLLIIGYAASAQDNKINIIPPSPEASALGKYGNIPVSLYTGLPNISIPIYTVQSGDINVPITLSYHASGIRVDEEASWVGLGWTLQAGGVITRTVRGKDDLIPQYYLNTTIPEFQLENNPEYNYTSGCVVPMINSLTGAKSVQDLTSYVNRDATANSSTPPCGDDSAPDFEPDQYNFSFLGYSGKFMVKRNKEVVLASKEKIEIKPIDVAGEVFKKWEVRTKDGFKYIFDEYESYTDELNCSWIKVKTAWYLTKIISPKGRSVTFQYVKNQTQQTRAMGWVYERKAYSSDSNCPAGDLAPVVSRSQNKYTTVTLEKIFFDHGEMTFDFSNDRADLENGKRLNSISVSRKNTAGVVEATPFKAFNFTYDYFEGSPNTTDLILFGTETPFMLKRLKLLSIQETGTGEDIPPHYFTYHEAAHEKLPSKVSFARDHWGYYNGALSNTSLIPDYSGIVFMPGFGGPASGPLTKQGAIGVHKTFTGANREPSSTYMKAFTLKEITYPTGGKTEFKFEQHDFDEALSNINNHSGIDLDNIKEETIVLQHSASSDPAEKIFSIDLSDVVASASTGEALVKYRITYTSTSGLKWFQDWPTGNKVKVFFNGITSDAIMTQIAKCLPEGSPPLYNCNCIEVPQGADPDTYNPTHCETFQTLGVRPGIYQLKTFIDPAIKSKMTWIEVQLTFSKWVPDDSAPISYAGGLRVSEIIDYNYDNAVTDTRKFNYNYKTDVNGDGLSEIHSYGRRMSKPLYMGYEFDTYPDPYMSGVHPCYKFVRTSDSVLPLNGSANGSVVGYDHVEVLYGKDISGTYGIGGKTVYNFENNPDYIFDYGLARRPGLPNYASNRNGLQKRQRDFRYNAGSFVIVKEIVSDYPPSPTIDALFGIARYEPPLNVDVIHPCIIDLFKYPAIKTEWIKLTSTTEINYGLTGDPLQATTSTTQYFYDNEDHLQLTRKVVTNSNGDVIETQMKYPHDFVTPSPVITDMITRHIVDPVIETITRKNGKVIGAAGTKYNLNEANADQILPEETFALETAEALITVDDSDDGASFPSYAKKATFEEYDSKGNILEYRMENDVPTAFLWGYNHTLPIASVENATYDQVISALGTTTLEALQTLDGLALRDALGTLRTELSDSRVTIYTYDPLVGMTTQTDANGNVTTFEYDKLNRLEVVRDHNNDIVKMYRYHYKNE